MSLALINGRLFQMFSSSSLPVANTRCIMSEWPNQWMVRLLETTDRGVVIACSWNCHSLCLWFLSVAHICSGFIMITRASGLGMGVGRLSRPLRGVGVLAMPDVGLDTTRCVKSASEVPPDAGVPCVAVGVYIDHCCVVDGVEVTCWVISAKRVLFSHDEGVQFWPWIVEATELPPWEEFLLPAGTEMHLLAGQNWEFPKGPRFCTFRRVARLRIFYSTGVVSGLGCWEGIFQYECSMLRL